jgi:2,5-diketo-D-gluconate reductase A
VDEGTLTGQGKEIRGSTIPKSVTPARINENFEIFDFELSDGDVAGISALNKNQRTGADPDKFDLV